MIRTQSRGPLLPAGSWVAQAPPQNVAWQMNSASPMVFSPRGSFATHGSFGPPGNLSFAAGGLNSGGNMPPTHDMCSGMGQQVLASPTSSSSAEPFGRSSSAGFGSGNHGAQASKLECQDQQCAEEACDPDECGDERRPPQDDNLVCGIDRRPLLPLLLASSTVIGCIHMMTLQFPLTQNLFNGACCIMAFFLIVYAVTFCCMGYCALSDPGQLKREAQDKISAVPMDGTEKESEDEFPLPKRAHKTWLYKLPIRRYDHYCRWLTNCIGLLNHREFFTMCSGLVIIGICGTILDFVLLIPMVHNGNQWLKAFFLLLHIIYSLTLTALVGPIFRLHVGFISRNELANEWKRNDFYVITSAKTGKRVPVNELSDDEFNERFDAFEYDKERNVYDKNLLSNWWSFCCTPRWGHNQLGEF